MIKTTESESLYNHLERKSTIELAKDINTEDKKVAMAVETAIPHIVALIDVIHRKMNEGGRLFYVGAGTSGRLGILDASECPPTYGVPPDWVIGIIAGGDGAIRKSVEHAEDSIDQCWKDLQAYGIDDKDVVVGIAASGTTPYVIEGLKKCNEYHITTGCITCTSGSPLARVAKYPIEVIVGPEYVTGSTRMKSGTAQKMVLNMITTATMIKLGRVQGNRMVDMQLSNNKLIDRGTMLLVEKAGINYDEAKAILLSNGSIRNALQYLQNKES
jgi:N-acetylmuramic acid 6-phosphate etherase